MASGPRLRKRAREIAEHQSEVDQLKGRIRELEGTNSALGISYRALARVERARARYGADERSERFIAAEKVLVRSLTKLTGSQRRPSNRLALALDWHYRQNPRGPVQDPIGQSERAYQSRISTQDRDRISEYILAGPIRSQWTIPSRPPGTRP
jgi:septal ring factor EnvC (AmiA/AmiB activator)